MSDNHWRSCDKKTDKTRGNAKDLGNLNNGNKTDDQETRREEFHLWEKYGA